MLALLLAACGTDDVEDVRMRHPELARAADDARAAVAVGIGAIPTEARVEVSEQYDREAPCQEPPDDGPEGATQWTVSSRAFLRPGTDADAVAERLRGAYSLSLGWRPVFEKPSADEIRVQVRRDDLTVTITVGRDPDRPQAVVSGVTSCLRNGG